MHNSRTVCGFVTRLRYRQYCTRRLRRIRKSVGMTHGKGRKYVPLEITHILYKNRHLMVPLFLAERVGTCYGA